MPRKRPKQVILYLTEEEHKRLKSNIKKSKLNQGEYIRRSIFKKEIIVIDGLVELMKELKKVGNNLNQLTRAVNSGTVWDFTGQVEKMREKLEVVLDKANEITKRV